MTLERKNIFEFTDYREYLKYSQNNHPKRQRRRLSLEEWATRLGYKSPRSVGMILSGLRFPNEEQIKGLVKDLGLNAREREYFELLIEREKRFAKAKSPLELDVKIQKLLGHVKNVISLDHEHFSYIANWYFLALRKWAESDGFEYRPLEIKKRFRDKISLQEIERAFETMAKLGLVDYEPGKSVKSKTNARIKATLPPSSHAGRLHHTQMMQRGMESMSELPTEQREFNSWTFRMNPRHFEKLKMQIREWGEQVTNEVPEDKAEIYQLCVQCYPHTSEPKDD